MGFLRWTPDQFWSATPHDLNAAIDGFLETKGISPDGPGDFPTWEETLALMEQYPDDPPSGG